jgi:HEAT repeat protein
MKNALKNDSYQRQKDNRPPISCRVSRNRVNVFILYALFSTCTLISPLGCNDSVKVTTRRPDAVFISDLVPEATRIVQQALTDEDTLVRVDAIELIATTKQIKLMPEVQRLLRDESVWVRFAAALAIGDLQYLLAKGEVAKLLNDGDGNVRIAAAYAMSRMGSADSFKLLRKAIASSDQTVRANAALLLGKSGDRSALKFLWWVLGREDSNYMVRLKAAEAIARLGDEHIFRNLWAAVFSGYVEDRIIGIRAMGALGTAGARDVLVTKLDDEILEVRLAAAEQLGMLGDVTGEPEVLEVFRKNLTAKMRGAVLERVNVRTALAIGRIGTARLTRFLPRLLKDESKSVRIAAAKAVFQCMMRERAGEKSSI